MRKFIFCILILICASTEIRGQSRWNIGITVGTPGVWMKPRYEYSYSRKYLNNSGIYVEGFLHYRFFQRFYLGAGISYTGLDYRWQYLNTTNFNYDWSRNVNHFVGLPLVLGYDLKLRQERRLRMEVKTSVLNAELHNPVYVHFRGGDTIAQGANESPLNITLGCQLMYFTKLGTHFDWGVGLGFTRVKEGYFNPGNYPRYRPGDSDYWKSYFGFSIDGYFLGFYTTIQMQNKTK